jgi:hypothetical protein
MVIPNPWVWRHDGTIQCSDVEGEALEEAREQLAALIGEENILQGEKRTLPCPILQMCGLPTGQVNAFQITIQGWLLLLHGTMGMMGWAPWTDDCPTSKGPGLFSSLAAGPGVAAAQSELRVRPVRPGFGGGGTDPTRIDELYFRPVRCYRFGDPITKDYVHNRVNIVHNQRGRIVEIWFG